MAREVCEKVNIPFEETAFRITHVPEGDSFRVSIADFATFVRLQPHRRSGVFHCQIPVLTDRGQICYDVSAFELPNDFIKAVSR